MAICERSNSESPSIFVSGTLPSKLIPFLIFAIALIPRLVALDRYVTPDEPMWIFRSIRFREALLSADWANTIQSGHPGVTTTWLGMVAAQIKLWLDPASSLDLEWIQKLYWFSPENGEAVRRLVTFLTPARLTVALVTSLGIVAIYWFSRNRLGPAVAVLGALFLALDPFIVGLSGLFHVDALLATFMLLAIVLVLPWSNSDSSEKPGEASPTHAWHPPANMHMVLAGIFTALAGLSKSPGLYLLILIPLIVLWNSRKNRPVSFGIRSLAYWAVALIITSIIALPAIWANTAHTVDMVRGLADRLMETAVRPTFFMGQETLEPGASFYPLALAFRLSPAVSLGLLAAVVWTCYRSIKRRRLDLPANIAWLLVYTLTYTLFITLSAKRFDRYALPVFMSLVLVSAWGIIMVVNSLGSVVARRVSLVALLLIALLHTAYLLLYLPYPLTAYNWLAGGPSTAQTILPIGWGEGASAAGRWAAQLDGAEERTMFVTNVPAVAPFFPGRVLRQVDENLTQLANGDIFLSVDQDWQLNPGAYHTGANDESPVPFRLDHVPVAESISFGGLPRATIQSGLNPEDLLVTPIPIEAQFHDFSQAVQIVSAGALPASWPDQLPVAVVWRAGRPADYQLRLELADRDRHSWVVREYPLLNEFDQTARHWPAGETQTVYYSLPVPAELAPGEYELVASLFNQDGERLGVFDAASRFRGTSARLASLDIEAPVEQPPIKPPIPLPSPVEVAGFDSLPAQIWSGERLVLDLWWEVGSSTGDRTELVLLVGSTRLATQIQSSGWRNGQTYHIRPAWRIPADLPSGSYATSLQKIDDDGVDLWPNPLSLGEVEIINRERIFELPQDVSPLQIRADEIGFLQSASAEIEGESIVVTLVWQARQHQQFPLTVFVHLRDASGKIIDQDDRFTSITTDTWVPDQVIVDRHRVPIPATGHYEIAVGMYDSVTGNRLKLYAADDARLQNDHYLIEVIVP